MEKLDNIIKKSLSPEMHNKLIIMEKKVSLDNVPLDVFFCSELDGSSQKKGCAALYGLTAQMKSVCKEEQLLVGDCRNCWNRK